MQLVGNSFVEGAALLTSDGPTDERGSVKRFFESEVLSSFHFHVRYSLLSINPRKATLRGFHYQEAPFGEAKVLSLVTGSLFNVVYDARAESPTYGACWTHQLDAAENSAIFVPRGCANAFLTLESETRVTYLVDGEYRPKLARGFRFDDPKIGLLWPLTPLVISKRDREWPLL
jgi:dTDP-4-dehydrorhamnose 3,5-epimerase